TFQIMLGDEVVERGLELRLGRPASPAIGSAQPLWFPFGLALLDEFGPRLALAVLTHGSTGSLVFLSCSAPCCPPNHFYKTTQLSCGRRTASKPICALSGPLITLTRVPGASPRGFGSSTKPLRSRDLISAITASGTFAGSSPSITSRRTPADQRASHQR